MHNLRDPFDAIKYFCVFEPVFEHEGEKWLQLDALHLPRSDNVTKLLPLNGPKISWRYLNMMPCGIVR